MTPAEIVVELRKLIDSWDNYRIEGDCLTDHQIDGIESGYEGAADELDQLVRKIELELAIRKFST